MLKIKINEGEQTKSIVVPDATAVINIDLPISDMITASWNDTVNKKAKKTMDDLCKDVADILKNRFGFKILREEQPRLDADFERVVTEGHPSDYKNSLSLYYYIRYDMKMSDDFAEDGDDFKFSELGAVIECDFIVKVTNHPFSESGTKDTHDFDNSKLNDLSNQEGSRPYYRNPNRQEVVITDLIKTNYQRGLEEVVPQVILRIQEWRKKVKRRLTNE